MQITKRMHLILLLFSLKPLFVFH